MPQTTCRLYSSPLHPLLDRRQWRWLREGPMPAAVTFENSASAAWPEAAGTCCMPASTGHVVIALMHGARAQD